MNPSLQAYLLQCLGHDAVTVDQAVLLETAKSALEAILDHGLTPENSGAVIENVNTAYASVTDALPMIADLRRQLAAVSADLADFRERFYDEVWQTAGCLTLAEGNTDYPPEHLQSMAMKAVIALRQERDDLRAQLDRLTAERDAALDDANYWHSSYLEAREGGE